MKNAVRAVAIEKAFRATIMIEMKATVSGYFEYCHGGCNKWKA